MKLPLRVGCAALAGALGFTLPALGADAPIPILVSGDWLAAHLRDPKLVLLHVAMLHSGEPKRLLPGARVIDYHALTEDKGDLPVELPTIARLSEALRTAGVSDDSHVILYGEGAPHIAARAFVTLDYLGHERVSVLDGGLEAWVAEKRPIVEKPVAGAAGRFTARPREDRFVSADWIKAHLDDPKTTLIDARPADEYTGRRDQRGLRGGHIPGAYNLYFLDLVSSSEIPRLKDLAYVKGRFAEAGAAPGGTLVNYCFIGMRASYTYLVARHLGYDARFYDPSWAEWGRRADLPAVAGDKRR